jgi:hypothetical protein
MDSLESLFATTPTPQAGSRLAGCSPEFCMVACGLGRRQNISSWQKRLHHSSLPYSVFSFMASHSLMASQQSHVVEILHNNVRTTISAVMVWYSHQDMLLLPEHSQCFWIWTNPIKTQWVEPIRVYRRQLIACKSTVTETVIRGSSPLPDATKNNTIIIT